MHDALHAAEVGQAFEGDGIVGHEDGTGGFHCGVGDGGGRQVEVRERRARGGMQRGGALRGDEKCQRDGKECGAAKGAQNVCPPENGVAVSPGSGGRRDRLSAGKDGTDGAEEF